MKEPDPEEIFSAVRGKYTAAARSIEGLFTYPVGRRGAEALGYPAEILDRVPADVTGSFCGVGNPFLAGKIRSGESVCDLGCGAGFDLLVAAAHVGPEGEVCGVDLTPAMVARAQAALDGAVHDGSVRRAEAREGAAEAIPFEDASFDVVLSNGVLNLSPRKREALGEIHRVLRPGGRLQFADIVLREDLPAELVGSLEAWSQ